MECYRSLILGLALTLGLGARSAYAYIARIAAILDKLTHLAAWD